MWLSVVRRLCETENNNKDKQLITDFLKVKGAV